MSTSPQRMNQRPLQRCGRLGAAAQGSRSSRFTLFAPLMVIVAIGLFAGEASAQLAALEEGFGVGEWYFRPTVALRLRGEYRRFPVDVGGDVYSSTAVLADGFGKGGPSVLYRDPAVSHQWALSERARLGMTVEYYTVAAVVVLQDARVFGLNPGTGQNRGTFSAHEAYLDIKSEVDEPRYQLRAGRQKVRWGDGRLIGDNEWLPNGGALDALRILSRRGDFKVELLAALLAMPGALSSSHESHHLQTARNADGGPVNAEGTGAQLYGIRGSWQLLPMLSVELASLARVVRLPFPTALTPSDTYLVDARAEGEYRGFEYAAEGAYEFGRVASFGKNRDLSAFAASARVAMRTRLPWQLRFGVLGAYASGDDSGGTGDTVRRFDPILPEVHGSPGAMDLYGWSNGVQLGLDVSARPRERFDFGVRYVLAGLAEPADRWSTAAMTPVGVSPDNDSMMLGNELNLHLRYQPWDSLGFGAAYGVFLLGDGGRSILSAAGRGAHDALHFAHLQAELKAP